jgi:transcriptional regulator with XRE-family HTH domain
MSDVQEPLRRDAMSKIAQRSSEQSCTSLPGWGLLSNERMSKYARQAPLSAEHQARKDLLLRMAQARGITNLSRVAQLAGVAHQYLDRWLTSKGGHAEKAATVAEVLGVSLDQMNVIRTGLLQDARALVEALEAGRAPAEGDMRVPVRLGAALPVRYQVQAGAWLEVDDMMQARIKGPPVAADERFPVNAQWLEMVRGDSVDLYFPEGSFVHVVDAIEIGYVARDEDFVVVDRKREQGGLAERSLKQIAKKGRKIELWPRSRNPKWQSPLNYADRSGDETTVEIAALVLGGYLPVRR